MHIKSNTKKHFQSQIKGYCCFNTHAVHTKLWNCCILIVMPCVNLKKNLGFLAKRRNEHVLRMNSSTRQHNYKCEMYTHDRWNKMTKVMESSAEFFFAWNWALSNWWANWMSFSLLSHAISDQIRVFKYPNMFDYTTNTFTILCCQILNIIHLRLNIAFIFVQVWQFVLRFERFWLKFQLHSVGVVAAVATVLSTSLPPTNCFFLLTLLLWFFFQISYGNVWHRFSVCFCYAFPIKVQLCFFPSSFPSFLFRIIRAKCVVSVVDVDHENLNERYPELWKYVSLLKSVAHRLNVHWCAS